MQAHGHLDREPSGIDDHSAGVAEERAMLLGHRTMDMSPQPAFVVNPESGLRVCRPHSVPQVATSAICCAGRALLVSFADVLLECGLGAPLGARARGIRWGAGLWLWYGAGAMYERIGSPHCGP